MSREIETAVQERTDWMYRHLCSALGWEPVQHPTHRDWDRAVATVRKLAEGSKETQ